MEKNKSIERRNHSRLDIKHKILLYIGPYNEEVVCEIKNISEDGICFSTKNTGNEKELFVLHDEFCFQYVDVFKFGFENEPNLIAEQCKIIRVDKSDNWIDVGCSIYSKTFRDYVKKKKLVTYL